MSLRQYGENLPNLLRLMSRGMRFGRFFLSSTSSGALAADLSQGRCATDGDGRRTLAAEFAAGGYACGECAPRSERDWRESLRQSGRPAFVAVDVSLRAAGVDDIAGDLRAAHRELDAAIGFLTAELSTTEAWDDTMLLGYGDAGAGDGRNGAMPRTAATWAPLFLIAPPHIRAGRCDRLASAVDVRPTLLSLAFPGAGIARGAGALAGVDLFRERRAFAFSRASPRREAYAATDGEYRLLYAPPNGSAAGGLALYCEQPDPFNTFNLLKLFRMDAGNGSIVFSPPEEAVARHFAHVFGASQVAGIAAGYEGLRSALLEFVAAAAGKRPGEAFARIAKKDDPE